MQECRTSDSYAAFPSKAGGDTAGLSCYMKYFTLVVSV